MIYFTIEELTASTTANRKGITNNPTPQQKRAIVLLIEKVLTPAREQFGKPIRVTSGFRSAELNQAVGGAATSQHTKGEAADLKTTDNARLFYILKRQNNYDQLIWEYGDAEQPQWVHVSYNSNGHQRHQTLRAVRQINGKTAYFNL